MTRDSSRRSAPTSDRSRIHGELSGRHAPRAVQVRSGHNETPVCPARLLFGDCADRLQAPDVRRSDGSGANASTRRDVLRGGVSWALCGAAVGALQGCTIPARSHDARVQAGKIRVPVARYPELERDGGRLKVRAGDATVFLVRESTPGGGLLALSAVCTHLGCIVQPSGDGFRCPCHGSTFGASGELRGGPARRALRRFPVDIDGDDAVIDLNGAVP